MLRSKMWFCPLLAPRHAWVMPWDDDAAATWWKVGRPCEPTRCPRAATVGVPGFCVVMRRGCGQSVTCHRYFGKRRWHALVQPAPAGEHADADRQMFAQYGGVWQASGLVLVGHILRRSGVPSVCPDTMHEHPPALSDVTCESTISTPWGRRRVPSFWRGIRSARSCYALHEGTTR